MVVQYKKVDLASLDLGYLALFLGQRVNELVLQGMSSAGFRRTRESHGYVIQHLIDSGRTITELAGRMGVTQQAASKSVAELVALKIVKTAPAPDRRARTVCLTERGWNCIREARRLRKQVDRRLEKLLGTQNYSHAKSALMAGIEELGGVERIRTRRVREPQ